MHRDDGSTLPLVAGLLAVVLGAACAIIDLSSLYLERSRLAHIAESAARVGAESFDITGVTVSSTDTVITLEPDDVRSAAAEYLAEIAPVGVSLESATTSDGHIAAVTVSSSWVPPVAVPFMPSTMVVIVSGSARLQTR